MVFSRGVCALALLVCGACASAPPPSTDLPPIVVVIAPPPPGSATSSSHTPPSLPTDQLAPDWVGTWQGDGYRFTYKLHLEVKGASRRDVEGYFEYTLTEAPDESSYSSRIGEVGREYVRGTWESSTRELSLRGYRVDVPGFLSTDEYRLQVAESGRQLQGRARGNSRRWDCTLQGRASR